MRSRTDRNEGEFLEPAPRERRRYVAAVVALGIVGFLGIEYGMPAYFAYIGTLPLCDGMRWMRWTIEVFTLVYLWPAIWMFFMASRILRHDQWPPPGTRVWRRTRVVRGAQARRRAHAMRIGGVLFIACIGLNMYFIDRLFDGRKCAAIPDVRTDRSPRSSQSAFAALAPAGRGTTSR